MAKLTTEKGPLGSPPKPFPSISEPDDDAGKEKTI